MELEKLLEALERDSMARLRHAVLREAGVPPFSLRAMLVSKKRLLRYACHLVLDGREHSGGSGGFDMEKFKRLKEGEHGAL